MEGLPFKLCGLSSARGCAETSIMSRLTKNILYNLAGQSLLLALGFVAVRYVFRQLGADSLGIIYFASTLNAVLCPILDMGMGSTTVREISVHAVSEPSYVHDLLRTLSSFYWAVYLLLAAGVYGAAPWLVTKWIHLTTLDPGVATQALQVLGVGALLVFPRALYAGVVRGLQRMEVNNLIDVATSALQQGGTILILVLKGHLLAVIYWLAGCFALGALAYFLACTSFFSLRALLPGFSLPVVKRNLAFSSRAAAISILGTVHTQADKAIVSKLLPLGVFGYYSFAWSGISRGTLVTSAVSQAALPSLSSLFKAGDRKSLIAQYQKLQDLLCLGMVPLFAAIPYAAVPLFTYLLNAEAARLLLLPATFLCIGFYLNGTLNVPYVLSLAAGKPEITARGSFYALFVVLPLSIVLIYFFGLKGAGLSWIGYQMFAYAYVVPRICSECLNITTWAWYARVLRMVGLAVVTYGGAWIILDRLGGHSIPFLVPAYLGASLLFLAGAYVSVGEGLRQTVLEHLQALRLKIAYIW